MEDREERRESGRIRGEDGGFSGVTALGGAGVTHRSKVEQWKAGDEGETGLEED